MYLRETVPRSGAPDTLAGGLGAAIGIDLGTTNTVVAYTANGETRVLVDETGASLLPSVVSFHPDGRTLVGREARKRRVIDAENTFFSIKRLIGRQWGTPEVEKAQKQFPFAMKEGPKNELPAIPDVTEKFTWRSGGGGMVSTAADYARFLQMLANGGQFDGVRLLSRKSIDLMTADALPPDVKMGADMFRFEALEPSARMGQGFGLGFAVRTDVGRNPLPGTPGDYYWGGAYGTYFWQDPKERLYVVYMMQSPAARLRYRYLMRDLVYQAMVN